MLVISIKLDKMEDFYKQENLISSDWKLSPSRRFKLLIRNYKSKPGCWNVSRGTVYRVNDNEEVADIKRNYSFTYKFFNRDSQEWLATGRSYLSQTFVNLDTGQIYDNTDKNEKDSFSLCWAEVYPSPDGKTLAVEGCIWGGSFDIFFFDFSNPEEGWIQLKEDLSSIEKPYAELAMNQSDETVKPKWNEDGTFTWFLTKEWNNKFEKWDIDLTDKEFEELMKLNDEEYEKATEVKILQILTLKRSNDKMVVVDNWYDDDFKKRVDEHHQRKLKRETTGY